ncbi:MAG TPA: ATP-binding cassette domain-containing protein [Bacillales bacterium]|nr:ATP-binding cassette domain-containing protein [Bacillales bacterium]
MIRLEGLKKIFPTKSGNVTAVEDVNLDIQEGEIFGIIGYSGAGKSTLVRLLNALERPTEGSVTIAGKNLSKLNNKQLRTARREISMIFQHFNLLWSRTVRQNIAFPLEVAGISKSKRRKRVEELIQLVGLDGRGDSYPSQLSGGQKQRVGIARALANNPKVLLCDEATSALDPKTTDAILDLLVDINRKLGLTIVLITHEMHVIRKISHRVAVMENGGVVEQDSVNHIFRNPKQEITKDFVKQVSEIDNTKETARLLTEQFPEGTIAKLTFIGEAAGKPVISNLFKRPNVDVNILEGDISQAKEDSYGKLYLQLSGSGKSVEEALASCREQGVETEVISHAEGAVPARRLG